MNLLPLDPIVARLRASAPTLRSVGTAADLAAIQATGVRAGPMAFVILSGADAHEVREGSGPLRQVLAVTVTVLLGLPTAGAKGEAGLRAVEEPASQVRAALFGWSHPDALRSFVSAGEGLEEFDAKSQVLLYQLSFTTLRLIQETNHEPV